MGITIKLFDKGDEELLSQFCMEISKKVFLPSYWSWKYLQNPAGKAIVSLALADNKIVGRFGIFPTRIQVGAQEIIAGQIMETEILGGYRQNGLISHLNKHANEEFIKQGIGKVMMGFGTDISSRLAVRFGGYNMVGPVRKMVKVLNPVNYLEGKFRTGILSSLSGNIIKKYIKWRRGKLSNHLNVYTVHQFDQKFDDFWHQVVKGNIMIRRDHAYLNWRYRECPAIDYKILAVDNKGKLAGYIITYTHKKDGLIRGNIADIIFQPEVTDCAEVLLMEALVGFCEAGAATVNIWCPKGIPLYSFLREMKFVERSTYNYLVAKPLCEDISREFLSDESNWYYMIGDSDHHIRPNYSDMTVN